MATPQLARPRIPVRAPLPPVPKPRCATINIGTVNSVIARLIRNCATASHLPSIPKKIVSLVKSAKRYLLG